MSKNNTSWNEVSFTLIAIRLLREDFRATEAFREADTLACVTMSMATDWTTLLNDLVAYTDPLRAGIVKPFDMYYPVVQQYVAQEYKIEAETGPYLLLVIPAGPRFESPAVIVTVEINCCPRHSGGLLCSGIQLTFYKQIIAVLPNRLIIGMQISSSVQAFGF